MSEPATALAAPPDVRPVGLSDLERRILTFERHWYARRGDKMSAITRTFVGLRLIPYYMALNRVIESPAALAFDAVTVNRLRRQRDALMRKHRGWTG